MNTNGGYDKAFGYVLIIKTEVFLCFWLQGILGNLGEIFDRLYLNLNRLCSNIFVCVSKNFNQ